MSNTHSELMLEASEAAYEYTFVDFDGIGGYEVDYSFNDGLGEIKDPATGFRVIAYINPETNERVLTFTGTQGLQDAFQDLKIGWDQWSGGSQDLLQTNRAKVLSYMNLHASNGPIHLTGHSLGGALAQYAAYEYMEKLAPEDRVNAKITLTTFNAPGGLYAINEHYQDGNAPYDPSIMATLDSNAIRHYWNEHDLVSHLGDGHVGGNTYQINSIITQDFLAAHAVDSLQANVVSNGGIGDYIPKAPDYLHIPAVHQLAVGIGYLFNGVEASGSEPAQRLISAVVGTILIASNAPDLPNVPGAADVDINGQLGVLLSKFILNWRDANLSPEANPVKYNALTGLGENNASGLMLILDKLPKQVVALGGAATGAAMVGAWLGDILNVVEDYAGIPPNLIEGQIQEAIFNSLPLIRDFQTTYNVLASDMVQSLLGTRLDISISNLQVTEGDSNSITISMGEDFSNPDGTSLLIRIEDPHLLRINDPSAPPVGGVNGNGADSGLYLAQFPPGVNTINVIVDALDDADALPDFSLISIEFPPYENLGEAFNQGILAVSDVDIADDDTPPPPPTDTTINGTEGDDTIDPGETTTGNDLVYGLGGNDTIWGFGGHDEIHGGNGNDVIYSNFSLAHQPGETDNPTSDVIYGDAGNDLIQGSGADDRIEGGADNDILSGNNGNDTIVGGIGDDIVYGGWGQDNIEGESGHDFLAGDMTLVNGSHEDVETVSYSIEYSPIQQHIIGAGRETAGGNTTNLILDYSSAPELILSTDFNDQLTGGIGNDILFGGPGNDVLHGEEDDDYVYGSAGNDIINGGIGNDHLYGDGNPYYDPATITTTDVTVRPEHEGQDTILGGEGDDKIYGGGQDDYLNGGTGQDEIRGQGGDDQISGGDNNDILIGDDAYADGPGPQGNDTIDGGLGNDQIWGGGGDDVLYGGTGNDVIDGDAENVNGAGHGLDLIYGGAGTDTLLGNGGGDIIYGGSENDTIHGDASNLATEHHGNDTLYGEGGDDVIYGGAGNDSIDGGLDNDQLIGGEGNDRYFIASGDGNDVILDEAGSNDVLQLGVSSSEVALIRLENTLVINVVATGQQIDLQDWFISDSIEAIHFSDGEVFEREAILEGFARVGTDGDDDLTGTDQDDVFNGGKGNDTISGGMGNDTYIYNAGDGNDVINENYTGNISGTGIINTGDDTIKFGVGITPGQLQAERVDRVDSSTVPPTITGDLVIHINGADSITISDWFRDNISIPGGPTILPPRIEHIEFADGTAWGLAEINQFISAEPINHAPVVSNAISSQEIGFGEAIDFNIPGNVFIDPDGDALTYSAALSDGSSLPDWLSFNATTGTFTGAPSADDIGVIGVNVSATDPAGASVSTSFDLTVSGNLVEGSQGNDVFAYETGSTLIRDPGGDGDRIIFGEGITQDNLQFVLQGNNSISKDGTEFQINSSIAGTQSTPAISALEDGGFIAVWATTNAGANDGVYAQRFDVDGNAVGTEFLVKADSGNDIISPSVAGLARGGYVIGWQKSRNTTGGFFSDVSYRVFDQSGNQVQTGGIGGHEVLNPDVSASINGGFVIAAAHYDYNAYGPDARYISVDFVNSSGGGIGSYSYGFGIPTEKNSSPSVAALSNGNTILTWTRNHQHEDGSFRDDVYARLFDEAGNSISENFTVNSNVVGNQSAPDVAALANGEFVVAWVTTSVITGLNEVHAGRFDVIGNKIGDDWLVSTDLQGNNWNPSISTFDDGSFFIAWTNNSEIAGQFYDVNGVAQGDQLVVNSHTDSNQNFASVATLQGGTLVATWGGSYAFDNDLGGVSGQLFNTQSNSLNISSSNDPNFNLIMEDWSGDGQIEFFEFADGTVLTAAEVESLLIGGSTNTAPQAIADSLNGSEDQPLTIATATLLANDSDADGNSLSITSVNSASHGTVVLNGNGDIVFTPESNYHGPASFDYSISDGQGGTANATVNIAIAVVNDTPELAQALADQVASEGNAFNYTLAANSFTDVDGDVLAYSATLADGSSLPAWLSFNAATQTFAGTPAQGDADNLALLVTATDPSGESASDSFSLDVSAAPPTNTTPQAVADALTGTEDQLLTITAVSLLANDNDADGDTLSITAVNNASHGTVTLGTNGDIVFSPEANYNGPASFDYSVTDGQGGAASATVNIDIAAVNDTPELAQALTDQSASEGSAFSYTFAANSFTDPDGDALAYSATLNDGSPLPTWLSFDAATQTFSGTPSTDDTGNLDLLVTATDPSGASISDSFSLDISATPPTNTEPQAVADTLTGTEEQPLTITVATLLANDTDADGDPLSITAVSNASHGSVALDTNGDIIFTPEANYHGPASFDYMINDGRGGTGSATVSVDIAAAPPPSGNTILDFETQTPGTHTNLTLNGFQITNEDSSVEVVDVAEETENAASNIAIRNSGWNEITVIKKADDSLFDLNSFDYKGVWSWSDGAATVTGYLDDGSTVTDSFNYTSQIPQATLTLNWSNLTRVEIAFAPLAYLDNFSFGSAGNAANATPQAIADSLTGTEDQALTITAASLLANDTDADGDPLTITAVNNASHGTVALDTNGDILFIPEANYHGPAGFDYTINDGNGGTASSSVSIDIAAVNDAPTLAQALADQNASEGNAFSYAIAANSFTDLDGDVLAYSATQADGSALPAWLSFDGATQTFNGTPASGDAGNLSLLVTAADSSGASVSDSFSLDISVTPPTNTVPQAVADSLTGTEDQPLTITAATLLANDNDADGDILSITAVNNASHGTVTIDTNGDIIFIPEANYHGPASFDYTVNDGNGGNANASVSIDLAAVNDAPTLAQVLADQTASEDNAFSYVIAANSFIDLDGDALTYSATQADGSALPAWLSFDAVTQAFNGTPASGDVGNLSLLVTATDPTGASISDNFSLDISSAPPPSEVITLDFEGQTQGSYTSFTVDGFQISNADSTIEVVDVTVETDDVAPNIAIRNSGWNEITVIKKADDNLFDLNSFDYKGVWSWSDGAATVTGYLADGSTVTDSFNYISQTPQATLTLNWTNLTRVEIAFAPLAYLDNFSFGAGATAANAAPLTTVDTITGTNGDDVLVGTSVDETLLGEAGNDTLNGEGGNDILVGGQGDDTYHFGRGHQQDVLLETLNAGNDALLFTTDISHDQLWFTHSGDDLSVQVIGTQDSVTIQDWYAADGPQLETITASDGLSVTANQVEQLVSAMAAFAPPASGELTLPADLSDQLAPTIAASWG